MEFSETLNKYDSNQKIESSVVFPFEPARLLVRLLWNLLFTPFFIGISFFVYKYMKKTAYDSLSSTDQTILMIVGLVSALVFLVLLMKIISKCILLINYKKHVIIFTNNFVVKRLGGKVSTYYYNRISKPHLYIKGSKEFAVEKISFFYNNQEIDFINGRIFGSLENIFQELNRWTKNDFNHKHTIVAHHRSNHY
jgi:hypothetical protein